MEKRLQIIFAILILSGLFVVSGCSSGSDVLTAQHSGRRVGKFDVDGQWVLYEWTPAQNISTQGHLVLLDTTTGDEIELVNNLRGPIALSGGRAAWWNGRDRDDEGKADVILYDIDAGSKKTIAHAKVRNLDLGADHLVWEEGYKFGSDIVLYDFDSSETKTISKGGSNEVVKNRDPKTDGSTVAWEAHNLKEKTSEIAVYHISDGTLKTFGLDEPLPKFEISEGNIVYRRTGGGRTDIFLYDTASGSGTPIASPLRLTSLPHIEGDKIVWTQHIPKEEFRGVRGQPLMDEKDFREIYLYDVISGGTEKVAGPFLGTGGRARIAGGRVYMNIYRKNPPPGKSNLIVPVDLHVW